MAEDNNEEKERPLVERWLEEQQEWQKTMLRYMDSMANNEEFLVHLGNAMRGSLLAGKPYPGTATSKPDAEAAAAVEEPSGDDRLDRILFALHEIQGQLNDLQLTVESLIKSKKTAAASGGSGSSGSHNAPESGATGGPTSGTPPAHSNGASEAARRARVTRKLSTATAEPKLRRSQPRSGFGRPGGDAD